VSSTTSDTPGEMLGEHYRIEHELGHGGMATVYLCTDVRDGSRVAVKVLRPELGSVVTRERFFREIAFASELDHPRIPRVIESGLAGKTPYYAMKFIDGESLRDKMNRERRLSVDDVARLAAAIAEPIGYAHRRNIIHRDIKPENVLLSGDKVYVLDLGVARAILDAGGERLTRTGITVGTPAYMSPEQVRGEKDVDFRSDIYSLGCVVYEMLAGISAIYRRDAAGSDVGPVYADTGAAEDNSRRRSGPRCESNRQGDGLSSGGQVAERRRICRCTGSLRCRCFKSGSKVNGESGEEDKPTPRQAVSACRNAEA
jgi:Serine/threonine protein kinase